MKKFIYSLLAIAAAFTATSCNDEGKGITPSTLLKQNYIVQYTPAAQGSQTGEYTAFAEFVTDGFSPTVAVLPAGSWVTANDQKLDLNYASSFNYGVILPDKTRPETVTFKFRKNDVSTFTNTISLSNMPSCSLGIKGEGEELKMDTPYNFEFDGPEGSTFEVLLIPASGATITTWYKGATTLKDNTFRFVSSTGIPAGPYYLRGVAKYSTPLQEADGNAGGTMELHYVCQKNVVVQKN